MITPGRRALTSVRRARLQPSDRRSPEGSRDAHHRHGVLPSVSFGFSFVSLTLIAIALTSCRQDMHDQPKYIPLRASTFFADSRSARPIVEGTVARGHLRDDELTYTGKVNGQDSTVFPAPVDAAMMARGRERFDIYCSPCHGRTGQGDGMIVRRGYRHPPSFHQDRLRTAPVGHFFDVITNGFGAMPDYATQIRAEDRWAIIAYLRALQLSENATLADVPPSERDKMR
jgi:mono/diheme cytochrome c family protein